jgi:hypothetical protein
MEIEQVVKDGVANGSGVAIAAVVVWLLVAYFKSDKFPVDVPPGLRPFLALGLGQSYAALAAIVGGKPVAEAVIDGVVASGFAVAGQEFGKPLPSAAQAAIHLLAEALKNFFKKGGGTSVFLLFFLGGCVSKEDVEAGINGAVEFHDKAAPCLMSLYAKELADCAGNEVCMAKVHEVYGAAIDGSNALRKLVCAIDKTAEGCADE